MYVSCMVAPSRGSLLDTSANSPLRVTDHDIAERPGPGDFAKLSAPLSSVLSAELDGAQRNLGLATEEILLAALGRAISRTIGDGVVSVDLAGEDRWLRYPVPLPCVAVRDTGATEMLATVHRTLSAVPQGGTQPSSDIFFSYLGAVPELPAGLGHALELRVYRTAGVMNLDWWFDIRRFDCSTMEELTEQFPLALIELTSEAVPPFLGVIEMAKVQ